MRYLSTWAFWDQALERCLKTAAQSLLAVWFVGDVMANVYTIDWANGFGVAGASALLSLLTSIVSASPPAPGQTGDPSVVAPEGD